MIRSALAQFIVDNMGMNAYVFTPEFVPSEHHKPNATVTYLLQSQELWAIGDAQRKEVPRVQVQFYLESLEKQRDARARFIRKISSSQALDSDGNLKPGIDYLIKQDILVNSGDNLTYVSNQPNWFAAPTPIIYVNDVAQVGGYTVNLGNGSVTFGTALNPADVVKATYKVGVVDFTVVEARDFDYTDLQNTIHRYNLIFDLQAFFLIKTNANKWL